MACLRKLTWIAMVAVAATLISCGGSTFTGSGGIAKKRGKTAEQNPNLDGYRLSWLWPCAGRDVESEPSSDQHIVLKGVGPHELSRENLAGAPVHFKGESCGVKDLPRDIVFVIDVSGSMGGGVFGGGSDRLAGGTCGRLEAIKKVIQSASLSGVSKFGIVTFSDVAQFSSSQLFESEDLLFADVRANSGRSSVVDVVCAANSNTDYEDGLTAGLSLLDSSTSNQDVLREMYFISDGEPEPADRHGSAVAKVIRGTATLATVMLGNKNDSIMKNDLASKDNRGAPLHARANNSKELADTLANLAGNQISKGVMSYGNLGGGDGEVDFTDDLNGNSFSFDGFAVDLDDQSEGIEVEFSYLDSFGNVILDVGKIVWTD